MATLSRGQTFGATETITNTKLHALVDSGSISSIVNADCDANMALVDTKLADITTGNKVSGKALFNLASVPSGAGQIPGININALSLASVPPTALVSIPSSAIVSLEALKLTNLSSIPTAQQVPYNLLVSSLASGAYPRYNGAANFVGGTITNALTLIAHQAETAVTSTTNIAIQANKHYLVFYHGKSNASTDALIGIRFNDATANYINIGDGSAITDQVDLCDGTVHDADSEFWGVVRFSTLDTLTGFIFGEVNGIWETTGSVLTGVSQQFRYNAAGTFTSIELMADSSMQNAIITVYEMSLT